MIDSNYFLLNVLLLAVGTLVIRGSFIAVSEKVKISHKLKDLFTYIPAAILPGLIIPSSFYHQGVVEWMHGKERFVVLLLSMIVCSFIKHTLFCICFGLGMLYLLQ